MVLRPKRILWPTDFSPESRKASDYVRSFGEVFGSDIHIVHVSDPEIVPPPGFPSLPKELRDQAHAKTMETVSAHLDQLVDEAFPDDRKVSTHILTGRAWFEICKYAKESGADLIIIATHGWTGLRHILMGSVAERVVQHAFCPVLVVKSVERDFTP
jgi:nucleotide-binding universal stress UspA family protein